MRLPYTDNPPKDLTPEEQEVLKRVQARRGEKGLIPLDLALLHSPNVTDGEPATSTVNQDSPLWYSHPL